MSSILDEARLTVVNYIWEYFSSLIVYDFVDNFIVTIYQAYGSILRYYYGILPSRLGFGIILIMAWYVVCGITWWLHTLLITFKNNGLICVQKVD